LNDVNRAVGRIHFQERATAPDDGIDMVFGDFAVFSQLEFRIDVAVVSGC
jgi:hypothetical protein